MDHFTYRGGTLHAEDVAIPDIAADVGTPFYVYSAATLERHYRVFEAALAGLDHMICYSIKANGNLAVIATLARLGRLEDAAWSIDEALSISPDFSLTSERSESLYCDPADIDHYIESLRMAGLPE